MEFLRVLTASNKLLEHHGGTIQFMVYGTELRMHAMINGNGMEVMEIKRRIPMIQLKQMNPDLAGVFLWDQIKSLADELIEYKISQKKD